MKVGLKPCAVKVGLKPFMHVRGMNLYLGRAEAELMRASLKPFVVKALLRLGMLVLGMSCT